MPNIARTSQAIGHPRRPSDPVYNDVNDTIKVDSTLFYNATDKTP
jgi:hypothetical protein